MTKQDWRWKHKRIKELKNKIKYLKTKVAESNPQEGNK